MNVVPWQTNYSKHGSFIWTWLYLFFNYKWRTHHKKKKKKKKYITTKNQISKKNSIFFLLKNMKYYLLFIYLFIYSTGKIRYQIFFVWIMESWNPYLYGFYLSFLVFTNVIGDNNEEVEFFLCQQASFYAFKIYFHDL